MTIRFRALFFGLSKFAKAVFEIGQMANPLEFLSEVRAEARKVTWPTRRETMVTTAMVLVMVVVASIFFLAVDQSIHLILGFILGLSQS